MISVSNIFLNNTFVNIAQSTRSAMSIETGLKATGRPSFILLDNNISKETKKYAAAKELLYQLTCLAIYMGVVLPVFRKGGFQIFRNTVYKNKAAFHKFRKLNEFSEYNKLKAQSFEKRSEFLKNNPDFFTPSIQKELSEVEIKKHKKYATVKGADEFSSILGSVIGLAILAPQVSHITIHPIMKFLGLEKNHDAPKTENKQPANE